jgi:hypothetical protein
MKHAKGRFEIVSCGPLARVGLSQVEVPGAWMGWSRGFGLAALDMTLAGFTL